MFAWLDCVVTDKTDADYFLKRKAFIEMTINFATISILNFCWKAAMLDAANQKKVYDLLPWNQS